jgi:hypothetical protein
MEMEQMMEHLLARMGASAKSYVRGHENSAGKGRRQHEIHVRRN